MLIGNSIGFVRAINYLKQRPFHVFVVLVCCYYFFWIYRNRHDIATEKDKVLGVLMIVLAVLSNLVAVYRDAHALFKKNESPRE